MYTMHAFIFETQLWCFCFDIVVLFFIFSDIKNTLKKNKSQKLKLKYLKNRKCKYD
jgi:hypothetical protein